MHAVRTLLEGILDYAGLFPPAKLDMASTVGNFRDYWSGPEAWMLGRLIVPVARFEEFEVAAASMLPRIGGADPTVAADDAWPISALTAPAGDAQFARDLDAIRDFNDRHVGAGTGSAIVDCIEVRAASAEAIDQALDLMPDDLYPYFELAVGPGPGGGPHADPRGAIAALAGLDAGAKIRTGGVTPDAHPAPKDVARFILACARAKVPFKATAGLHHPLRHDARDLGCKQHGFLNVFVGAALAWHDRIDEAGLAELLSVETIAAAQGTDPSALRVAEDGVAWRGLRLTTGELRTARESFAHAFGSCSFDEPLADLRAMGLLRVEAATP